MSTTERPRCVVLGLDGLPYSLACALAGSARFPNLNRLVRTGYCRAIKAELPELSPVNWTSFMTGVGPEEHGIFGFTRIDPDSYVISLSDASHVQTPTLFDRLGAEGLTSKIINLPNTYPARPLKGMLISGFPAPDLSQAVYPKFLLPRLEAEGYTLEADTTRGASDPEYLLAELKRTLAARAKALELFWPDLAWDLFVLVLTETDRLGHFLFPALTDEDDPWHEPCLDLLMAWDGLIGAVLDRWQALPEPKRLVVLADHGFTALSIEVDLNAWLKDQGLLLLDGQARHELDCSSLSHATRAFALDPGRIYLHTRDRFRRGSLDPMSAASLQETIAAGLMGLRYDGEPVMKAVYRADELYPGTRDAQRPDLVCVPRPGFDLKAKFDRSAVFGFFGRRGTHLPEDAFFYDSTGERIERVREAGQAVEAFFEKPIRPGRAY